MSTLLFVLRRSIVNAIKSLGKKPAALIAYVVLGLFFMGMLVMVIWMPQGSLGVKDPAIFRSIMAALSIIVYYFSIRQGIEKGSSMFRAPDVNFVFAGPFRPNDALLYGFLKQMGTMLLVLFVAFFQIPNLKNNFALQPYGIWLVVLAVALFALSYPLLGMAVYAFSSKSAARKRFVSRLLNLALALVLALALYNMYQARSLLGGLEKLLDAPALAYFPVVGWMRSVAAAAVDGVGLPFWVGLACMVATIAGSVLVLYRLNLDYYEEVLAATEYREAALTAKREGKSMQFSRKARRKVTRPMTGHGASVLFGKNMLELQKSAFVLFFDQSSLIIIASALAFKFLMSAIPDTGFRFGMFLVLAFGSSMLFILQMQGRWPNELGRHFIFTLPARPAEKLFWVTAGDHIKNLIDGTALFAIAGAMMVGPGRSQYQGFPLGLVLVCIVAYAFLGGLFIYTDILARRLFGGVHSKPLLVFMKLFLTGFIVTPGIIAAAVVGGAVTIAAGDIGEFAGVAVFALWAVLTASGMFALSAGIFKNIEASA